MDNRLTLGKVHIVEWLNQGDDRTGWKLFDDLQPLGIKSDPRVEVDFHRIETAGELLGLLLEFTEEYRRERRTPLLHLETHGERDGIGAREQELAWRDLAETLAPLNRLTGVNLVIILAACWGFYGVQMLRPNFGPAAFRGLIAPHRKLDEKEVLKGCLAFYRTVFSRMNGDDALKTMNDAIDPMRETFWHVSAETAFMLAFQNYLAGDGSPEGAELLADGFATFQQLPEEPCGRPPIAPRLHENVEDVAVLVHGTPQILLLPLDLHEELVQIPGVALAAPAAAQPPCVVEPERPAPQPDRLIRHGDTPLGKEIFDISETQAETVVEPDGVTDDF